VDAVQRARMVEVVSTTPTHNTSHPMNQVTYYILRHATSGQFFNGTNFSEENASKATRFDSAPTAEAVRLVWACPVQIIAVSEQQVAKLNLACKLESRAATHLAKVRDLNCLNAAQIRGARTAASRLRQRATRLAVEVYATFPRVGHNVAA